MKVETTKDGMEDLLRSIKRLVSNQVLVGVPAENATRDAEDGKINNAAIGYVQEFGSPARGIPPRPHLIPGVEKASDAISNAMRRAAKSALSGKNAEIEDSMMAAGQKAVSSVKAVITAGAGYTPLKPGTIANRFRQRKTISRRKSEKAYLELVAAGAQAAGMSEAEMQAAAGIKPLINSGAYLNSITYVLRKK